MPDVANGAFFTHLAFLCRRELAAKAGWTATARPFLVRQQLGMAAARSARRPRYAAREQRATKRRATRVVRRAAMPASLVAACASRRNVNRQRVDDGRTDGPPRVVLQCSAPSRHGFPLSGITRGSRLTRRVLTRAQVTGFAVAITFGCLYLIRRALERV